MSAWFNNPFRRSRSVSVSDAHDGVDGEPHDEIPEEIYELLAPLTAQIDADISEAHITKIVAACQLTPVEPIVAPSCGSAPALVPQQGDSIMSKFRAMSKGIQVLVATGIVVVGVSGMAVAGVLPAPIKRAVVNAGAVVGLTPTHTDPANDSPPEKDTPLIENTTALPDDATDSVADADDEKRDLDDAAEDAAEHKREAAEDAAENARDAAEQRREAAEDAAESAREAAEQRREAAERKQDAIEEANDAANDAADAAQDAADQDPDEASEGGDDD